MVKLKEVGLKSDKSVFGQIAEHNHEQVVFCHDQDTGLKAIIGIHNTVLGPALGGTRMWSYASEAEALADVLRLSRGMTYKAAISGLNLGGGKAVIIGDANQDKNEALLRKFGRFIKNLNGCFITAEDVGMTTKDMEYIRMETKHVSGLPEAMGGGGDPSPVTAYGTYMGMKAAAKKAFGSDSLQGRKIAVQGVGYVGAYLVELLSKENADIYVSDIYEDRLREVAKKYNAQVVSMDRVYDLDVDIYSPCGLGGTINADTIGRLKCQVIAGCANNQLRDEQVQGPALAVKGIVYAPDFLINAGGLINVYAEIGGYNRESAYAQTERIYGFTLDVFDLAEKEGLHNQQAAMKMAEQRIERIGKVRATF
ncbi:leucine dehydrogenase [Pontibacter sp. E15-1]|uniref:Glu/Leu/Phe/Val dehydrogenase dimerization domain-containing protein n=1 Tax=Pontibacter sp. E15-1 TaxID=2919918 RepID=UPI001F4FB339|nr:Glu/Leu/Phe/Val dehydrogenase dimerization domain-containing protein [Pontibacter sp. E15-1]MCJ8166841.1 leucine dehydrogenase [Pontibacter sp. E15-1]